VLRAENLLPLDWLRHGFSTRRGGVSSAYGGGSLNLGVTPEDTREAVQRNRELFLTAIGACGDGRGRVARGAEPGTRVKDPRHTVWPIVAMRQFHSSLVHVIDDRHLPKAEDPHLPKAGRCGAPAPAPEPLRGDGLIGDRAGIVLAVRTADCLPVLVADPVHRAVGAFHAGWRGTLARIVEKGVGEMRRRFGSHPGDLKAAIGPGIHRCCYEVSEDLREKFASQFAYAEELFEDVFDSDPVRKKYPLLFMNMRAPGHGEPARTVHLDLVEANRRQLRDAGVGDIWISDLCTSCRADLFFSHRRDKGVTGRMMSAVGIA
jgi:hypothetical protein